MRALCLALALCCVSYAAAADPPVVDGLAGSELTAEFMANGRNYIVHNIVNSVTFTAVDFKVTGITSAGETVKKAFFIDEAPVDGKAITADGDVTDVTVTWTQDQLAAVTSKTSGEFAITYQVYTVENDKFKASLASTEAYTLTVLDLKAENPESVSIVRNGCDVEFNMLGIYSSPPMRTFCGFLENGELLANLSDAASGEGVVSFDSITYPEDGKNTKWEPITLQDADGNNVDGYAAWQLTEGKLNVKNTDKDAAIGAACLVWLDVDGQTEVKEYYGEQTIEVPAKHRCPANPLTDFAANKTDVKYKALQTVRNCWTEEDSDIAAEMSCTGEGKTENSFTVYCEDGAYKAYSGSKDKAEAWNEDKATAWADETCGTAGILPMSLLVGALALFASRA